LALGRSVEYATGIFSQNVPRGFTTVIYLALLLHKQAEASYTALPEVEPLPSVEVPGETNGV
jgi:hypothetical protein